MYAAVNLWPLLGIAAIVVGFILRFNPVIVVVIAGVITGLTAQMPVSDILEKLGSGFLDTRNLPFILLLPLAVVGLLERHGLKERAQAWIARIRSATAGRLLIIYLLALARTAMASCRFRCATACGQWRRQRITSACSSARTSS